MLTKARKSITVVTKDNYRQLNLLSLSDSKEVFNG